MVELAGMTNMHGVADGRAPGTPQPRLVRAAHEFEAQMMKELLAPMTRTGAVFGADDGEDAGVLGEFATESLAGALSAGGGLGIANRIIHALSTAGRNSVGAPTIETAHSTVGDKRGQMTKVMSSSADR